MALQAFAARKDLVWAAFPVKAQSNELIAHFVTPQHEKKSSSILYSLFKHCIGIHDCEALVRASSRPTE